MSSAEFAIIKESVYVGTVLSQLPDRNVFIILRFVIALSPTRLYSYLKMAKHFFKILADTQSDTEVEIERTIVIIKTKKEVVFQYGGAITWSSLPNDLKELILSNAFKKALHTHCTISEKYSLIP